MAFEADIFCGELVRLTVEDAENYARPLARWQQDTHWQRLMDSEPPHAFSEVAIQSWLNDHMLGLNPRFYFFLIRSLGSNLLIGDITIPIRKDGHGDAFVGIAIGDREFWGKGYGTDAMRILLRFAFTELSLHRVSLDVFEYNPRAIRSYEKAGFKIEGRERLVVGREGQRWDSIYMGILREEWQALQTQT